MKHFKELVEFGPMGGDQRNMRGSTTSIGSGDMFDGTKIKFPIPDFEDSQEYYEEKAKENDVEVRHLYFDDVEIKGKKAKIISFLKASGFKPKQYKSYF